MRLLIIAACAFLTHGENKTETSIVASSTANIANVTSNGNETEIDKKVFPFDNQGYGGGSPYFASPFGGHGGQQHPYNNFFGGNPFAGGYPQQQRPPYGQFPGNQNFYPQGVFQQYPQNQGIFTNGGQIQPAQVLGQPGSGSTFGGPQGPLQNGPQGPGGSSQSGPGVNGTQGGIDNLQGGAPPPSGINPEQGNPQLSLQGNNPGFFGGQHPQGQFPGQVNQGQAPQINQGQIPPGQFTQGQIPPGQFGQGQLPPGQFTQGQLPPGQFTQGQLPPGQFQQGPQGQIPSGQFPQGQVPPGQFPQGQVPPGQFPQGQVPPGQFTQGQFPPGQFSPGQLPPGQFPINQGNPNIYGQYPTSFGQFPQNGNFQGQPQFIPQQPQVPFQGQSSVNTGAAAAPALPPSGNAGNGSPISPGSLADQPIPQQSQGDGVRSDGEAVRDTSESIEESGRPDARVENPNRSQTSSSEP